MWCVILVHSCVRESKKSLERMEAVAFHSPNPLRFTMSFSFSRQCYFGKSSLKEVAVQPSPFVLQKVVSPFTISSIRSDADKDGQISGTNENEGPQIFNGKKSKSSDQEEILALFRRIQSSISKGGSQKTSKRSSNADKDKPSTESILDILGEPKKQVKAGKITNRAKEKDLTSGRSVSRKEQEVQEHPLVSEFKLTRPPSNFVKKSPIPYLSTPRGKAVELTNEALPTIMGDKQAQSERLEKLKLAELKELAKSRRVKGYSKLKKVELLKILGDQM